MSKSMKALVLAGVLSFVAASAVQAGGKVVGSDFRGHANVAPAGATPRSGQIPALWRRVLAGGRIVGSDFHASATPACDTDRCPLLAGDGGPVGVGEGERVAVAVADAVGVTVHAAQGVGVRVAVAVTVAVEVRVGEGDVVAVAVTVGVAVHPRQGVGVALGVGLGVVSGVPNGAASNTYVRPTPSVPTEISSRLSPLASPNDTA